MHIIKKFATYGVSSYDDTYLYKAYLDNNLPEKIIEIKKFNVFVRLHKFKDEVFISIRGTDEIKDWFNNLKKWKTPFINNTKVHCGFLDHLNYVYDDIINEIKKYKKINIIGHSLGGAISVLLGSKLCYLNNSISCNVVTYGSPRVGDKKFKELCNSQLTNFNCFRVYNKRDIVTKLPYIGFHHIGLKKKIKTKHVPFYKIKKNHSMITYMKSLYT